MPTAKDSKKICFQRGLSTGGVNPKGFSDVTIITGGIEALGHGLMLDETSIDGLMPLLMGKTLPGYLTHEGVAYSDRLTNEIGLFSGFYRDGLKIKAKQFSFLNSFSKHNAAAFDTLMELADKVPDQFGLSIVFTGEAVWPGEDGDVSADEPRPDGCSAEFPSVRFSSVQSADFVKAPAANPAGLFARIDGPVKDMATAVITVDALAAKEAEVTASLSTLHKSALDKLTADHVAALAAKDTAHISALATKDKELMDMKDALGADVSALKIKLQEAEVFDVRKSGAPEAIALAAQLSGGSGAATVMPAPGKSDADKWNQFSELKKKDAKLADAFRDKYIPKVPLAPNPDFVTYR